MYVCHLSPVPYCNFYCHRINETFQSRAPYSMGEHPHCHQHHSTWPLLTSIFFPNTENSGLQFDKKATKNAAVLEYNIRNMGIHQYLDSLNAVQIIIFYETSNPWHKVLFYRKKKSAKK